MRSALLLAVGLVLGCSEPTAPQSDLLTAVPGWTSLALRNNTPDPVFFMVVERNTLAIALLALCKDPDRCPKVPRRGEVNVPYTEIYGYHPGAEGVVLHWRLMRSPAGGFEPDSVRYLVTPLR